MLGVGVAIFAAAVVLSFVTFVAFSRTSLAIVLLSGMGFTCVMLGLVRQRNGEDSSTLIGVGAGFMAFATFYAVFLKETI